MLKDYKQEETPIEDITLLEPESIYSYADYLRWAFEDRVELIKGKFFKMAAAPGRMHQGVSTSLISEIAVFLKGKKCKAYHAPFDVRLPKTKATPINRFLQWCSRIFVWFAMMANWTKKDAWGRRI